MTFLFLYNAKKTVSNEEQKKVDETQDHVIIHLAALKRALSSAHLAFPVLSLYPDIHCTSKSMWTPEQRNASSTKDMVGEENLWALISTPSARQTSSLSITTWSHWSSCKWWVKNLLCKAFPEERRLLQQHRRVKFEPIWVRWSGVHKPLAMCVYMNVCVHSDNVFYKPSELH